MGSSDDPKEQEAIKRGGCPTDCFYYPYEKNENGVPTQPRSYLSEPGNMRATQNKHHPVGQTFDRIHQLEATGHISANPDDISKIEGIISVEPLTFMGRTIFDGLLHAFTLLSIIIIVLKILIQLKWAL